MSKKESENKEEKNSEEKSEGIKEKSEDNETKKLKKELSETKELFLRTAAEYDNFRKRSEREKTSIYGDATSKAVSAILPLADSLDAALNSSDKQSEEYKKGIELLQNQLKSCFAKLNVEPFGDVGDDFDPNLHNAISHVEEESDKQNFVSTVFQKGYKIGDKIIRHAMVQVTN
ncbi:MAG: nucleotide exchange factor GrpE [Clostridia bacterium]|nr:nucleotide exchange factor GrpE [Clostridia bacterium]